MLKTKKTWDCAPKRLKIEREAFLKNPPQGYSVLFDDDNYDEWRVLIDGPNGTPYEGEILVVIIKFHDNYPFSCPNIRFARNIYHAFIPESGKVCNCDYLSDWVPTKKISYAIDLLIKWLNDPFFIITCGCENERSELLRNNPKVYFKNAEKATKKYALEEENAEEK